MRYTVFGASGFIGSALAHHLREAGHDVNCPAPSERYESPSKHGWAHAVWAIGLTADFRSRPFDTIRAHVSAMADVLERARFDSFLYLSSTRIYQYNSRTDEDVPLLVNPTTPSDLYNISKLAGESLCLSVLSPTVRIARLSNVVGPRESQRQTFIGALCREAASGAIRLQSALTSEKDYVWIGDAVPLLAAICLRGSDRLYNVASGRQTRHARWVDALAQATGARVEIACDAPAAGFPAIDVSRIRAEFGFNAEDPIDHIGDIAAIDV